MQDLVSAPIYSELKLKDIGFLERSYLYHLKPQGINSASIESLTSYIARLAQTHNVFPGTLMKSIIAPLMNKEYGGANLHRIYSYTSALNGTGIMAFDLVQALYTLTLQNDLQLLTMLPWARVIPTRHLFRSKRAWCPLCYEEWRSSNQVLYEPLIWGLEVIKVCAFHQQPLIQECPHCGHSNLPLAWKSRPGYCSRCQEWLGSSMSDLEQWNLSRNSEWLIWVANAVGELLAASPTLSCFPSSKRIASTLHFYVERMTDGNGAEFARQLQIPKNTFWLWHQGSNLPTLESLLRICYSLKTSLVDFLTGDMLSAEPERIALLPVPCQASKRATARVFDSGYLEAIQQQLHEFLESEDVPPLSMKEIAKRLGHDRRTLYSHFRELCHEVSVKHDRYQQLCYEKSVEQACIEVRRIVCELAAESVYPSEARVSKQMTKPGYLRYKRVRTALRDARTEISLS